MPVTYAKAAASTDSPRTGTSQLTWWFSSVTSALEAASGASPVTPAAASTTAPTIIPPHVMTTGGSAAVPDDGPLDDGAPDDGVPAGAASGDGVPDHADRMKYTAMLTAASSAQSTPTGLMPPGPDRSSISASPPIAATLPAMVSRRGRWPCRTHSHPTTSRMPMYSMSRAMPTGIR